MRKLSKEEVEKIAELYKAGYTIPEISRTLKIEQSAVSTYLRVLGLSNYGRLKYDDVLKIKELLLSGRTMSEIAKQIGVSRDYVKHIVMAMKVVGLLPPDLTLVYRCPNMPREVVEKYINTPIDVACRELNISVYCFRKLLRRYNIKRRKPGMSEQEVVDRLLKFFEKLGRNYSIDFVGELEAYDPRLYHKYLCSNHLFVKVLEQQGFKIFSLRGISTRVLPRSVAMSVVVYRKGAECDVLMALVKVMKPKVPLSALKRQLSVVGAPRELINMFYKCLEVD